MNKECECAMQTTRALKRTCSPLQTVSSPIAARSCTSSSIHRLREATEILRRIAKAENYKKKKNANSNANEHKSNCRFSVDPKVNSPNAAFAEQCSHIKNE